jgi:hypothetical protein
MSGPRTRNVTGPDSREREGVRPLELERPTPAPSKSALRGVRSWLAGVSLSRRRITVVGSIAAAALTIAIILATRSSGASPTASAVASLGGTTTIQYRDLILTDTESGTLGYANPRTVFDSLTGTITWLPSVGQVIKPGQTLYEVDDKPAILMDGTTPAYRHLTASDSDGTDMLQLNRDLRSLGFDPEHRITLDDVWQPATRTAVDAWQASLGEAETGTITLGQIVFVPGAQRIAAVGAALGSSSGGGGGGGAAAILQTTSNQLVVTVDLDATKQSEATVGAPVTVQLPSGNTVNGDITAVSAVAQSSGANSSSGSGSANTPAATIPMTISLAGRDRLSGLDQAAVSVNFQQQQEKHVLSVPVTALLATAGGGYTVQQASSPHHLIAVTPGLFAAGYVQISGAQARPGIRVTDSQG